MESKAPPGERSVDAEGLSVGGPRRRVPYDSEAKPCFDEVSEEVRDEGEL